MLLQINQEFRKICEEIIAEKRGETDWAEIESDDMFQTKSFCGGFDATEMAFCFSYYDDKRKEYWFQLSLDVVKEIVDNKKNEIEIREPN
jgi:hypothetical protein